MPAVQPPMICRQERILKNREKGRLKLFNTVPQVRISKQVLFESQAKVTRVKEMSPDRLNVSMDMTSELLEMTFKTRFLLLPQQQRSHN